VKESRARQKHLHKLKLRGAPRVNLQHTEYLSEHDESICCILSLMLE